MKERYPVAEEDASSALIHWAAFLVTAVFLLTGIWHMFLRPFLGRLGGG